MKLAVTMVLILLVASVSSGRAGEQGKGEPKNIPDFEVQGISFTQCQCTAYACPCRSNGHPTHGACDAADFAFIRQGHYGNVDMSGFKAVLVIALAWAVLMAAVCWVICTTRGAWSHK